MIHTEGGAQMEGFGSQQIRDNQIFGDEFLSSRMRPLSYNEGMRTLDAEYMKHLNQELQSVEVDDRTPKNFMSNIRLSSETAINKAFDYS